jgi:hypothetical protein
MSRDDELGWEMELRGGRRGCLDEGIRFPSELREGTNQANVAWILEQGPARDVRVKIRST